MSESNPLYHFEENQLCTEPLYSFISEYRDIIDLFFFIVTTATRIDHMGNIAAKVLSGTDGKTFYEGPKAPSFTTVRTFGPLMSKHMVTTMVNNFSCYLSEIIQAVVHKRPEVLRSSERLPIDEILQFTQMDDLIAYITDKKITELSYGGLKELERFISDRLGLSLFAADNERLLLTIFIELRNIHTHNRGVVSNLSIKRLGASTGYDTWHFKVGEQRHASFNEFCTLTNNAIFLALRLDELISKKFELTRFNFSERFAKHRETRFEEMSSVAISLVAEEVKKSGY